MYIHILLYTIEKILKEKIKYNQMQFYFLCYLNEDNINLFSISINFPDVS